MGYLIFDGEDDYVEIADSPDFGVGPEGADRLGLDKTPMCCPLPGEDGDMCTGWARVR